jgi:hypothetical protein
VPENTKWVVAVADASPNHRECLRTLAPALTLPICVKLEKRIVTLVYCTKHELDQFTLAKSLCFGRLSTNLL